MYSLYRAWLSLGPCPIPALPSPPQPPPPPLNLSAGAPDVALQVGPGMTHFSAHRAILSAHSGFFKAALLNHTESAPIAVPNVNVDEFSSLLTFMYTGYLDLNLSNIYNILLATHILHMPRALEICRCFLLQTQPVVATETQQQQQQPIRSSIIKPIASRKTALPTQQFYAPSMTTNCLRKSEATPFKTVAATVTTTSPPIEKTNEASTSADIVMATRQQQSDEISVGDERVVIPPKKSDRIKKKRTSVVNSGNHQGNGDDRVIVDIACCDGPVRFHRVVNKNYGQRDNDRNRSDRFVEVHEINRNAAMNKAMTENIRQMSDENGGAPSSSSSQEMFTCLYCNHTFKSQYCYQKHARRHINPVSVEAAKQKEAPGGAAVATDCQNRREVKLLDMNVQYYPCKTCGSKFPSYYFVHKHRKMCHAEEMMMMAGDGNDVTDGNADNKSRDDDKDATSNNNNNDSSIVVEDVDNVDVQMTEN